ncbi:MAG: MoxR family ATPase [Myxococcota bacterium]
MSLADASALASRLVERVSTVLRGKEDVVRLCVVALFARGHVLIEDVPGVGKTTLARSLAACLGLRFRRLQLTSDLMPSDVVGGNVFDRESGKFTFRPGPVFTQVLLADEINRTTPRTQSALLEAMGEGQVSIEGETHRLEDPFFVIATQNPQDFYGTYPLPESQLDRFLLRLRVGYPDKAIERRVLLERGADDPVETLSEIVSAEALKAASAAVDQVRVDESLLDYLHGLIVATREHPLIEVGASTRAALAFARAVRARAIVEGRDYAIPDDIKDLVIPLLSHRLRTAGGGGPDARADAETILRELSDQVAVPV